MGTLLTACSGAPAPTEPLGAPYRTGPWSEEERALAREAVRRLEAYDDRSSSATEVVSVRSYQDDAAEIVVRRCVDEPEGPKVQVAVVERFENRTWRVGPVETTGERCADRTDDPARQNG